MTKEQLMQKANDIFNKHVESDIDLEKYPNGYPYVQMAMLEMWNAALDEAVYNSQWIGDYFIGISKQDLKELKIDL